VESVMDTRRRLFLRIDLRGMPAGMTTTSAPVRVFSRPSSLGRYPVIF
jgi:hypothetical protein